MIRPATRKDIPTLIEWGWEAFPKTNRENIQPSPKKWQDTLEAMLLRPWANCVLIGKKGFLLGQLADYPYADALYAVDLAFWSEAGDGPGLLRAFEDWAKKHKAVELVITNSSGIERTDQFLEHAGFTRTGGRYARTI